MTTFANPMNSGVPNSSSISVPCMVNSSLYTWSETMRFSGSNSWSRITIAMIPAIRKNPNEVIRYMYPMTLWSVDDAQPASTEPLRSVRCRGMIGVPVTGGCWSMVLTWYHSWLRSLPPPAAPATLCCSAVLSRPPGENRMQPD